MFVSQVFEFVQNLIGCEEQARLFKEEVSVAVEHTELRHYKDLGLYLDD